MVGLPAILPMLWATEATAGERGGGNNRRRGEVTIVH